MSNFEGINEGHFLELMDRIHICSMMIQDHILDHPLVEGNPNSEIGIHLNKAMEHLFNAYQSVVPLEEEIEEGLNEVKQIREGEIPKPSLKEIKLNSVSEEEVEKGRSKAYDYKFK